MTTYLLNKPSFFLFLDSTSEVSYASAISVGAIGANVTLYYELSTMNITAKC